MFFLLSFLSDTLDLLEMVMDRVRLEKEEKPQKNNISLPPPPPLPWLNSPKP